MSHETEYHTELTKVNHTNYVRNSRAIVVMWAIFTIIYTILNVVVFIQPQWIGDTGNSAVAGYFGLWKYCEEAEGMFNCRGDFLNWASIMNGAFQAASVMVGVSCLLSVVCVACFLLFCLLNTATVLQVCGWFQLLTGFLMLFSCIVYPSGWDSPDILSVCGSQAGQYDLGECGLRWGFILAIVLVLDAFILAIFAFVLAAKQAHLLPGIYKEDKEPFKN